LWFGAGRLRLETILDKPIDASTYERDPWQCCAFRQSTVLSDGVLDALWGFAFGTPDLIKGAHGSVIMTYYAVVNGITHIRACRFVVDKADATCSGVRRPTYDSNSKQWHSV